MPERRPRADRAQQFMPFAALKGYYDLIRARAVAAPRGLGAPRDGEHRPLRRRGVRTTRGLVSDVDLAGRTVTVVRTRIPFDDIWEIDAKERGPAAELGGEGR